MKKITTCIFSVVMAVMVAVSITLSQPKRAVYADYMVEGGRFSVDFNEAEDIKNFQLFTEFDKVPFIMDGKLFGWPLAEQKIMLKGYIYNDVEVSVDLSTINKSGKIDAGIYLQAADVNYQIDNIDAWCVNVEHGAGNKTFNLKLHRFANKTWLGAKVEVMGIRYTSDTINLRVVLKKGTISAFLNGSKTPAFSYFVGDIPGLVGLRSFYAPSIFDNFEVVGEHHEVDKSQLNSLLEKAQEKLQLNLASASAEELQNAIELANSAITQNQVDNASKVLEKAIENAVESYSFASLSQLIATANAIENPNGKVYTKNSWNSFVAVRDICASLSESSLEYDISYWYERLDARIRGLVPYLKGVAE